MEGTGAEIAGNTNNTQAVIYSTASVVIEDVEVVRGTAQPQRIIYVNGADFVKIDSCIVHSFLSYAGDKTMVYLNASRIDIYNNLLYDGQATGNVAALFTYGDYVSIVNNSIHDFYATQLLGTAIGYGILVYVDPVKTANVYNNTITEIVAATAVQQFTYCYYFYDLGGNLNYSNNISDDSTAPGSNSQTGVSYTEIFLDADIADFRLTLLSVARDAGTDRSADINDDIIGTVRPVGVTWDIGAFEWFAIFEGEILEGISTVTIVKTKNSEVTIEKELDSEVTTELNEISKVYD